MKKKHANAEKRSGFDITLSGNRHAKTPFDLRATFQPHMPLEDARGWQMVTIAVVCLPARIVHA
jgi:hypothetical protein